MVGVGVVLLCFVILLTGLVANKRAGGRLPPRVADFEQHLANLKLFHHFVVSGTYDLAGYAEQCAGR
jgi:hypothetical protein